MDMEYMRNYCLSKKGATEDYPFGFEVPVIRVVEHRGD